MNELIKTILAQRGPQTKPDSHHDQARQRGQPARVLVFIHNHTCKKKYPHLCVGTKITCYVN